MASSAWRWKGAGARVLMYALAVAAADRAPAGDGPALERRLQPLLASIPKGAEIALVVADADSGALLFAYQPAALLKPASVQKLFVTAAALERWGPGFELQTRVYVQGDELWIVGGGDPGFCDERLEQRNGQTPDHIFDEWAAAIRGRGLSALSRIVIDDFVFDDQVRHPDWPDTQADRWYQAPVGGLNINDNCLDVTAIVHNGGIRLQLRPDVPVSVIDNKLKLGKRQRPVIRRAADREVIELSGTLTSGGALQPVAVSRPTLFFAQAAKEALQRRGIVVRGDVVRRPFSEGELASAALVATHGTALRDILWRCNTFSQNLFAECLLKALAAYEPDGRRNGVCGSWDGGRAVLRAGLERMGLDVSGARFRDGSGLSYENRATAEQLVRVLVRMQHHPHADVFVQSLAQPGELGSMQRRYDDPVLRGRLRGKTGTLAGVHALAGYLTRQDGSVVAFALLINGPGDGGLALRVCRTLINGE